MNYKLLPSAGISRNFFVYFFICLSVIFVVVFTIQWWAITLFVHQYESDRINDGLMTIRQRVYETEHTHREVLVGLRDIYVGVNVSDPTEIIRGAIPPQTMFYVFGSDGELVYGSQWESFIESLYFDREMPTHFVFMDGASVYQVSVDVHLHPVIERFYTYLLVSSYREPVVPMVSFRTYTASAMQHSTDKYLSQIYKRLNRETYRRDFAVYPIDDVSSFGVYSQYDNADNVAVVHIIQYHREIYLFLRQFYLIIITIVLGSFTILGIISFSFISQKIFKPIWNLVDKMKTISEKPQQISPISEQTHGEILQIYDYFNAMVASINEYQTAQERQAKINRTLELELVRINRLGEVGKRIQGVVHNLNTPLNSIIGYAQLLADELLDASPPPPPPVGTGGATPPNASPPPPPPAGTGGATPPNASPPPPPPAGTGGAASPIEVGGGRWGTHELTKIITAAKGMHDTIKQLLYKTLDDSIAMPVPVNINQLLKQELAFCCHDLFFKHNVQLELDLEDGLPELNLVYGDIAQVFQTLFNNAMEAMQDSELKYLTVSSAYEVSPPPTPPRCHGGGKEVAPPSCHGGGKEVAPSSCHEGGKEVAPHSLDGGSSGIAPPVSAGGGRGGGYVTFSVRDTGCGIPDDVIDRIFETGFSTKTMTHSSGFGIGLPLAKAIIDKIGGEIEVSSEVGKGSEFRVKLGVRSEE